MPDTSENRSASLRERSFAIALRGYHRREVDEFIARRRHQIVDLESRLSRALTEAEQARRKVAEAHRLPTPVVDDLSRRLRQIINLAEHRAGAAVARARFEADQIRRRADYECKEIVRQARADANQDLAACRDRARRLVASAGRQADIIVSVARREAEQIVADARVQAEYQITAAENRVTAINHDATRREIRISGDHKRVLRELIELAGMIDAVLRAENAAGSVQQMVQEAAGQAPDAT